MGPTERAPQPRLADGALDEALRAWPLAPLPDGFSAAAMARVRAAPRFRPSPLDALVAVVAAAALSAMTTVAGAIAVGPGRLVRSEVGLALARWWLAVRPVDGRLVWLVAGAVALAGAAVVVAALAGQVPRTWTARAR